MGIKLTKDEIIKISDHCRIDEPCTGCPLAKRDVIKDMDGMKCTTFYKQQVKEYLINESK